MGTFWFQLNNLKAEAARAQGKGLQGKAPAMVRAPELFTLRLKQAFSSECQALLDDGMELSFVQSGALAAGFSEGALADCCAVLRDATSKLSKNLPLQDIKDRLLFCMALESVRMLQESVLADVRLGNVSSVMEAHYPRWTGGVFQFLNQFGLSRAVERLQTLSRQYGERFTPPGLLIDKAMRTELFG